MQTYTKSYNMIITISMKPRWKLPATKLGIEPMSYLYKTNALGTEPKSQLWLDSQAGHGKPFSYALYYHVVIKYFNHLPHRTFASRVDSDQTALVRAA